MALIAPTIPTIGQPNSTEDADIVSALNTIVSLVNGGLDVANLATTTQNTFLKLATVANRAVAFGNTTVTFTASQTSAATTVNHGLGVIPVAFSLIAAGAPQMNLSVNGSPTSTTFDVTGYWIPGVLTGSSFFYWLAIG